MKSLIDLSEGITNKQRNPESPTHYFPAITTDNQPMLFTESMINEAMYRAKLAPEDMPDEYKSLFDWCIG